MSIDTLRQSRFLFLKAVYQATEADEHKLVNMWQVGDELGLERDETARIVQYLTGETLLEHKALVGIIAITHHGIREVEDALSEPQEETYYFPPVNIINVETMIGSAIQQASPEARQTVAVEHSRIDDIRGFVAEVREVLDQLGLTSQQSSDLNAELGTVDAQLEASRPKTSILTESLLTMRSILEGAAGSALAAGLLHQLRLLLGG